MKSPCNLCPFRKDSLKGWLGKEKATRIATEVLERDQSFPCHKTVDYSQGIGGQVTDKTQICAGSILLHEKEGRPNYIYRFLDADVTGSELIVDSKNDFISLHS